MPEVTPHAQTDGKQPTPYPLEFLSLRHATGILKEPEIARHNFRLTSSTVSLWQRIGLLLSVETKYPGSPMTIRSYVGGYITDLSAYLEANRPEPRGSWKDEVREFSRHSQQSVLLTKQAYDEALANATHTDAEEPYVDTIQVAELIGLPLESVEGRFTTAIRSRTSAVLRSTLDKYVSWQHEAFNIATPD